MDLNTEWQLIVTSGHGVFKGTPVIHVFDSKEKALAFLADYVTAPAIKAGEMPPDANIRVVIRHDHRDEPKPPAREAGKRALAPWCHADGDGYCVWKQCPQLRDGEPEKTGRHCPRDVDDDELQPPARAAARRKKEGARE